MLQFMESQRVEPDLVTEQYSFVYIQTAVDGDVNWYSHYGEQYGDCLKN